MLSIVSYVIKIAFSLMIVFLLSYFSKNKKAQNIEELLKINFIIVFLLSPLFSLSSSSESFLLFSIGLLLVLFISYFLIDNINYIYSISLMSSVLISMNYILYVFVGIAIYLFIDNNIIDIIKDNDEIDNKE